MKHSRLPQMKSVAATLLCGIAVLGVAACGDDEDSTTAAVPDLDRYCELVRELDASSTATFAELEEDAQLSDAEIAEAQKRVLDENAELIEEMERVAPEEIRDDLELSIESSRERVEQGDTEPPEQDVIDAGIRLQEFRRAECRKG